MMECPAQSPDLNPIENLWTDVKIAVGNDKLTNIKEFGEVVQHPTKQISKINFTQYLTGALL